MSDTDYHSCHKDYKVTECDLISVCSSGEEFLSEQGSGLSTDISLEVVATQLAHAIGGSGVITSGTSSSSSANCIITRQRKSGATM